jgi:streptogrisin C
MGQFGCPLPGPRIASRRDLGSDYGAEELNVARRLLTTVGAAGVIAATIFTGPGVASSEPADPVAPTDRIETPAQSGAGVAEEATLRWLRRTYGLSAAAATRRLERERLLTVAADRLTQRLGARSGGAWLDDRTGDLVVGVLDEAAAATARAAGARPLRVTHSAAVLDRTVRALDGHAASHGAGQATAWFVDVPGNAVVVEVAGGQDAAARDAATRTFIAAAQEAAGDMRTIRFGTPPGRPAVQRNMYGGRRLEAANGRLCTAGFTARDSAGRYVVVTAGHCTKGSARMYSYRVLIGKVRGTSFPGNDYGVVNVDNRTAWTPRAWVDDYDGYAIGVEGVSRAAVGASICKSGRTTRWTCGKIRAHNVTVNYRGGGTVYGLTQTTACSRDGDSGGSYMSGRHAQGMLSGGITRSGRCLEAYGGENISYFQPVGEALSRYGLRLLTLP